MTIKGCGVQDRIRQKFTFFLTSRLSVRQICLGASLRPRLSSLCISRHLVGCAQTTDALNPRPAISDITSATQQQMYEFETSRPGIVRSLESTVQFQYRHSNLAPNYRSFCTGFGSRPRDQRLIVDISLYSRWQFTFK